MKRLRVGLAAIGVLAAAAIAAGPASANHGVLPRFDPQTTNVPYLAWRGEELRLVKCSDDINVDGGVAGAGQSADWIVEDWSGVFFQPPSLESSTVRFFVGSGEHADEGCIKADFASLKAGLAMIKLVVSDNATGNPILKHQFLAGWLGLNAPVCRELAAATAPGGGGLIGDPSGNGDVFAGGSVGRIQCEVSGQLPLGNNFAELGLGASIRLPGNTPFVPPDGANTSWDELATRLATTSSAVPLYRDAPWRMWDIHDDRGPAEGHVGGAGQAACGVTHTAIDAVDACIGADVFIGDGRYSRAWGDLSAAPTFGPFDPLRADETMLPDGKLDGGDVPLPAARVDISIAPNTGGPTDISGAGSLLVTGPGGVELGVYKCIPYTRDHRCTSRGVVGPAAHPATTPAVITGPVGPAAHNHYAPFYSRWIPATNADNADEASGTDGPQEGNNFPGYRGIGSGGLGPIPGLYDFWQPAEVLRRALATTTSCRLGAADGRPVFGMTPAGAQSITLYSDEHGEVQAYFNPGTGFFFNAVLAANNIVVNANGGCDLENVDVLGTASITATARYPFQKTTAPDQVSAPVAKRVLNQFHKGVECVPKGPVPPIENGLAFICTAVAIDITGAPIEGELVCFVTNAEGAREFPLGREHVVQGLHRLCVFTDENGEAAIEVLGKCLTGNVIAEFVDEGILRFDIFTFACPPGGTGGTQTGGGSSSGGTTSAAPAGSVPGVSTQQTQQTIQQIQQQQQNAAATKPAAKPKKATLAFARIDLKAGARPVRYLVVRVNGTAKTARIQVTLVARNGRVIGKVVRTVRTNRVVRVPNLRLPNAVKTARVKVLA